MDIKHASSYLYDKSLPVVVTSNFKIDDLLDSQIDVDALKTRCKILYSFAPIAENVDAETDFKNQGIPYIVKPKTRILPEALIGLFLRWMKRDDYNPIEDISTLRIQASNAEFQSSFPSRKK